MQAVDPRFASRTLIPIGLRQYALAVLSVAAALGLALFLQRLGFRDGALPLLLFAVAIASWYGRNGPAALAAILSIVGFYWGFVEPARTIRIYPSQIPYFLIFAAFASLLSWFATTRRLAEAVLREQADLLDLTHDTVLVMDMNGVVRYWNRGAEDLYGWTAEQAVGRVVHDLLKTVPPAPIDEIKSEVLRTGRWEGELAHTRKNGSQVLVASRWSLERDRRGAPVRILETNSDVTERKRAEERIRRQEMELRQALDFTPQLIAVFGPEGERIYANPPTLDYLGVTREEWEGISDRYWFYHPDDRERLARNVYGEPVRGVSNQFEARIRGKDGAYRWFLCRHNAVRDEQGRIVRWYTTGADIEDRKRAEGELQASQDRLARERDRASLLLEINNHIISKLEVAELLPAVAASIRKRLGGDVLSFLLLNKETGCLEREFLDFPTGKGILAKTSVAMPSTLLQEWWQGRKPLFYSPPEAQMPAALYEADRAESILSAVSIPLMGVDGPLGLLNIASHKANAFDVADRDLLSQIGTQISLALDNALAYGALRASRDELRRSEAYLADAQRLSHTGSFAFDIAADEYVYVSDECCRIFELDSKGGKRETVSRYIHPMDWDRVQRDLEKTLRDRVDTSSEFRVVLPSGATKHIQAIRHPVLNETRDVVAIMGTVIDISERKQAEEQRERLRQLEADLAHIDRVSIVGELAASVAHEVNQPLTGIVSNANASLRWLAGDAPNLEEVRQALRRIVRDGSRAGEVIARIRALTRRTVARIEKLDPNETIREVLVLVGDEAKRENVTVVTRFADDLAAIAGDRIQLQQVVLNLVINAIEAMSGVDERPRELVISTRNMEPDQVQVTVEDFGIGIDPEKLDKVFDSFFTTKPGGMGMGLSISRSILQAHGGRLWAARKDGFGTMFHFTLPVYKET